MGLKNFFAGEGAKTEQLQKFTDPQQQTLDQLLSGGQQGIGSMVQYILQILSQDPEMMKQFEAPMRRQFDEETVPSIAERFTGDRGEGSQRSSAFGQQLGQAGAGLQEALGAQRANLGSNAMQQLMSLLSGGLTPRFENTQQKRQPGFLESIASSAAPGLASYGLSFLPKMGGV